MALRCNSLAALVMAGTAVASGCSPEVGAPADPPAPPGMMPPAPVTPPPRGETPVPNPPPASTPPPVATPPAEPPPAPSDETFTCTLVIGTGQTAEWYGAFEALVDNARWQLVHHHSGFVELWANAGSNVWSTAIESPCAAGTRTPDRILFLPLSGGAPGVPDLAFYTLDMWMPLLRAVVKNLQAKYPSARRIELMTYVRAPMNKPCPGAPDYRSMIGPDQDMAMAMVAAENPGLVTVAPQFAAASCADFGSSIPHSTAAARKAWGKMIAEHYGLGT